MRSTSRKVLGLRSGNPRAQTSLTLRLKRAGRTASESHPTVPTPRATRRHSVDAEGTHSSDAPDVRVEVTEINPRPIGLTAMT